LHEELEEETELKAPASDLVDVLATSIAQCIVDFFKKENASTFSLNPDKLNLYDEAVQILGLFLREDFRESNHEIPNILIEPALLPLRLLKEVGLILFEGLYEHYDRSKLEPLIKLFLGETFLENLVKLLKEGRYEENAEDVANINFEITYHHGYNYTKYLSVLIACPLSWNFDFLSDINVNFEKLKSLFTGEENVVLGVLNNHSNDLKYLDDRAGEIVFPRSLDRKIYSPYKIGAFVKNSDCKDKINNIVNDIVKALIGVLEQENVTDKRYLQRFLSRTFKTYILYLVFSYRAQGRITSIDSLLSDLKHHIIESLILSNIARVENVVFLTPPFQVRKTVDNEPPEITEIDTLILYSLAEPSISENPIYFLILTEISTRTFKKEEKFLEKAKKIKDFKERLRSALESQCYVLNALVCKDPETVDVKEFDVKIDINDCLDVSKLSCSLRRNIRTYYETVI